MGRRQRLHPHQSSGRECAAQGRRPEAPPVEAKPDIALERRKAKQQAEKEQAAAELKRQQKLEQEQQEKAERLAQAKADAKAKAQADAKAKALADAKAEKEQAELDKKLADKAAEKKLAAEKADKAAKAKRELADAKAAEKLRDANVKRMQDMLGNGASNSTGTAAITYKFNSGTKEAATNWRPAGAS